MEKPILNNKINKPIRNESPKRKHILATLIFCYPSLSFILNLTVIFRLA